MQDQEFIQAVENLVKRSPESWLSPLCEGLRAYPSTASAEFVLQRLPATANADLTFLAAEVVRKASGNMSWEALSRVLEVTHGAYQRWQTDHHVELLWAGPSPANPIPARRIDQALYDMITGAKREIMLVTFAATKIERLTSELLKAASRGVKIQLILEFAESSEGQLSYDAINAFPEGLIAASEIYFWPVEKRERNKAGRPGKLHAKLAIVDDVALVSSANLTDDAFNRNMELGVMVHDLAFRLNALNHIRHLIAAGILEPTTKIGSHFH
jgi:cardiolipin synthase